MLEIGSIVDGKYRVLSQVGQGGMSIVYMAINEKANKTWAIKEIKKEGTQTISQPFISEIDIMKKLKHPNLPSIVDLIDNEDTFLIVMDYIEGITLEKAMQEKKGVQSQEDVVKWAKELCDVLEYLHKNHIIYRDMKPSNIMLQPNGHIILIDFGIAREFKQNQIEDTQCLGTVGYAAPEQYGGQGQTDARTDIYSLGATMYYLLTGKNPAKPPYEMYPIRQINPSLSTGLEKIVLKCTQKDPSLRYQSGEELFYALENYHKLDNEVIRKNKKKMSAFLCSSMLTIIFTFVSIFSFRNYAVAKSNTYESLIVKAESTQEEEAWINYQKAVEMKPAEAKAYLSILEKVSADNVITSDEDEWIAEVLESHKAQFKQENPAQYLKFAYNLGKVYWFGYENEANRIQLASQWFRDILDIDVEKLDFGDSIQDEANKTKWKQRAEIFCRIADNTGKLELSDYDLSGEGGFSYSGYLDDFNQLIQEFQPEENQNSADRVAILYIYKQLVAKMISKCKEFRNDNVTKEVLLKILNEIETNTKILSVDTTQAVQVLCDTLLGKSKEDTTSIVLAKQAVETNFK